jgi:hypothetical protein
MKYLWHAFFARPDIPLLRLPWNALAIVGAAVAGFWDPAIWGVAGAGEFIYLFTLASNPGFQGYIDSRKTVELHGDTEEARKRLLSKVGGAARQRYVKLEEKRRRLDVLYRNNAGDDLFTESNSNTLRKLTWLYLNLLVAQRDLIVAPASDERDLQKQISTHEKALLNPPSSAARASTEATLRLLRERLNNIQHKEVSMAEIDADLARIDTQFDFALEEATLRGRPVAISANVELTSRLLDNLDESSSLQADESSSLHVDQSSSGRMTE